MRIRLQLALAAALALTNLSAAPRVIAVDVGGIIQPVTVEILDHAINQAADRNAAAVLIRLNTPGGLLDSSREITQKIVSSKVPVIGYVTPSGGRAASAGFFLLEATDIAAMAPGTNTGAASPVILGQEMDPVMRSKVENDTSAWLRSMVDKRSRNAELAEQTVRQAKAFTEKEALDQHLIDLIQPSVAQLLDALEGREVTRFDGRREILHTAGAQVIDYRLTSRERIIDAVADPNIGFILMAIGALGIYIEFNAPGLILPGVIGGILGILGLSSLAVLPINWIGVALLILGLAFFILEAKFASHGILGTGGAVSLTLGALLLVNGPPEIRIHLTTALSVSIPFAIITMFLLTIALRARRNKSVMGMESLLDQTGEARTALAPGGKVFLHGEYWDAVSSSPVDEGGLVRVTGVDGIKLLVEPKPR